MKLEVNLVEIKLVDPKIVKDEILDLLITIDEEFIPPLSSRESPTQLDFSKIKGSLSNYYTELLSQHMLLSYKGTNFVGMLSFIHKYANEHIKSYSPCNYISTISIYPKYQSKGIATKLYKFALDELPRHLISKYTVTRTWSSNYAHIYLLKKLGFILTNKLKDHRGKGIDTVYYAKFRSKA